MSRLKSELIANLTAENKKLQGKIVGLEEKVVDLEKTVQSNLQYQRSGNVVISGIPDKIDHRKLEGLVVDLFNEVSDYKIVERDIVAVHRLSPKSPLYMWSLI